MQRTTRTALLSSVSGAAPSDGGFIPIPVEPRPPLPPLPECPSCPSPYSYDQTLPVEVDPPPDERDYLRGNAWCVVVPGLPWVNGASSEHPDRFLSYLGFKYTPAWQEQCWIATAKRGYTHTVTSWSNFRDEYSDSTQAFVDFCAHAKRYVKYNHVMLASKDFDPRDMSFQQYADRFGPVIEAILKAGVVDEICPAWEQNLFFVPGKPTIDVIKWVGQQAHAYGVSNWTHFSVHVTAWFADGDPRGRYGFWDDLGPDCDGDDYQADGWWDIGETQARLVDTLVQFANQGNRHKLRFFEYFGVRQFSGDPKGSIHPTEDEGDQWGWLGICTHGPTFVWGAGGGLRRPNGSPV